MTPEFRRWLKQPKRRDLDVLAAKHGFVVKNNYQDGTGDSLVMIYRNSEDYAKAIRIFKGKGKRLVDIFHFTEAIEIIKKIVATD